jgi:hypothetical protein
MSRFAQYYIRFRHDAGCYDWEKRQQHLGALFERDESIEFFMGEREERKVYKHKVYHLVTAPDVFVMRFANNIDIPVERDFEPATAKDEPSCFVIIDNRDHLRTVAIQKRRKAFGNTHQVAKILSTVIDQRLFRDYCYGFEITPDYYPVDLFKVWEQKQQFTQAMRMYVEKNPQATYEEIERVFNVKEMPGGYKVVRRLSDIQEGLETGSLSGRFFIAPQQLLESGDGVKFAVSTQWEYHNFPVFMSILKKLKWKVKEV